MDKKHHPRSIHVEAMLHPNLDAFDFKQKSGQNPFPVVNYHHFPLINPQINEGNVINIFAGYSAGPAGVNILNCDLNIIAQYIQTMYRLGTKIVFDNSSEGGSGILFARLHKLAKLTNIPCRDFVLINALCNNTKVYDEFCKMNLIQERINVCGINTFELNAVNNLSSISINRPNILSLSREKTYVCFNRVIRTHRVLLLGLLLKQNLVDSGYYSFFPLGSHGGLPSSVTSIFDSCVGTYEERLISELKECYNKQEHLMPLRLNIDSNNNKIHVDAEDYSYFENSLFSLVTETFFFDKQYDNYMGYKCIDNDGVFFSEKIFKPIMMCHPFILVSRPNSLYYLKKIGYKTFSPFIDESYDNIENNGDRLLAIVKEVERINNFTRDEKVNWLKNVLPIAVSNYLTLKTKKMADFLLNDVN